MWMSAHIPFRSIPSVIILLYQSSALLGSVNEQWMWEKCSVIVCFFYYLQNVQFKHERLQLNQSVVNQFELTFWAFRKISSDAITENHWKWSEWILHSATSKSGWNEIMKLCFLHVYGRVCFISIFRCVVEKCLSNDVHANIICAFYGWHVSHRRHFLHLGTHMFYVCT